MNTRTSKNIKTLFLFIIFITIKTSCLFSQKGQFEISLGAVPNLTFMKDKLKEPKGGISSPIFLRYNITNRVGIETGWEYQYLRLRRANKKHNIYKLSKIPVLISYNVSEKLDAKKHLYIIGGYAFSMFKKRDEFIWTDRGVHFIRLGVESKLKKDLNFIFTHYYEWSNFNKKSYGQLYTINFGIKVGLS